MMYRRITVACSLRLACPVPSNAKYRSAANVLLRFDQDAFVGVQAISMLFAFARAPARPSRLVVRCGLKLPQMIAILVAGG